MEYLKEQKVNILIIVGLLLIIGFVLWPLFSDTPEEVEMAEAENVALSWLETEAPTYVFDGFEPEITSTTQADCPNCYLVEIVFKTQAAGFGDRTEEMAAQVITEREIKILVEDNQVTEAITDGLYSEVKDQMLTTEEYDQWLEEVTPTETVTEDEDEIIDESETEVIDTSDPVIPEGENGTVSLQVFFSNLAEDPEMTECDRVWPTTREISATSAIAGAALDQLLQGPTTAEKEAGLTTSINPETTVNNLQITEGVARVDFDQNLIEDVGGSCRVLAIVSQIKETLKQFSTITEVEITVDGQSAEEVLQP